MKSDIIGLVEAAYRVEQEEEPWLTGLCNAARPTVDRGLGIAAFTYNASNADAVRIDSFVSVGMSPGASAVLAEGISNADADYVRGSALGLSCGTASEVPGWHQQPLVEVAARDFGIRDTLTINGQNLDGTGCMVVALLPHERRLRRHERSVFAKLSCHIAAGQRLRHSLSASQKHATVADAILDRDGRVHHAEGEAQSKTLLSHLIRSAQSLTKARGSMRIHAPETAIDEWKGLIAARWTLVDVCDQNGDKYLVARQNRPKSRRQSALTDREQQVVAFAAMGHHNKLIAYNLGISDSTVRVLMARAAGKFKVHSRNELIQRFNELVQCITNPCEARKWA